MTEEVQEQNPTQDQKSNDKEVNFSMFRKQFGQQLEQEKQARLAAEEKVALLEQQRSNSHDDNDDDNEPYVDKKALRKEFSRFSQDLDKRIEKKAEEKARALVEQERQSAFLKQNSDFNQILTPELIAKFAEKHPEVAEQMLEMPDNFSRQKLLYQNIKALGLHKPPEVKPAIQDTIDRNRRFPGYQPSAGANPPYENSGDFSQQGQKNAYEKMKALINGRRAY